MTPVAEDAATITARIREIREAEKPRCPLDGGRALFLCLRSSARCPPDCLFVNDWIGSE
jgi:hypothetical protein